MQTRSSFFFLFFLSNSFVKNLYRTNSHSVNHLRYAMSFGTASFVSWDSLTVARWLASMGNSAFAVGFRKVCYLLRCAALLFL